MGLLKDITLLDNMYETNLQYLKNLDIYIAARKVGGQGRAIGVDMTPDMLAKARRNAVSFRKRSGLDNVEFRLGEIEHLPLADASVDVVISNCVLNLSPDKAQVWRELARVLRPGGRVAISDLALLRRLPRKVERSAAALVGCIAGAVLVEETERMARAAGLTDLTLTSRAEYLAALEDPSDPLYREVAAELPHGRKLSEYITSLLLTGRKPPLRTRRPW
jgi:SAM-dependent methyltransferase